MSDTRTPLCRITCSEDHPSHKNDKDNMGHKGWEQASTNALCQGKKAALLNTKRAMTPDRTDSTGRHTGWDCGVADPRDTGDWRG